MKKLQLYRVTDKYIDFLRQVDSINIKINKNEKRPYIGVVLEVHNIKYFAPLSSPKEKYKKMKNNLDFIKICNGEKGAINLNNMIPVVDEALMKVDIEQEEIKYRNLLYDQMRFINENAEKIHKKAEKLYISVTEYHSFFESRCAKFKKLEKRSIEYKG